MTVIFQDGSDTKVASRCPICRYDNDINTSSYDSGICARCNMHMYEDYPSEDWDEYDNNVTYTYLCEKCDHSEDIPRPTEEIICSKCGAIVDGCWWTAPSYEEYLKDQGVDKSDFGNKEDLK
jgi:ribosomal protein L37AE/L43A